MTPFNGSTFQLFNFVAAVHLENFLFLLFIVIAFFFQLLTRAASKSNKDSSQPKPRTPDTPPPSPRVRSETDEERIRKFLEALGQSPTSTPPPPVKTRPIYQKPIVLPHVAPERSPLPPLKTRPPELPRQVAPPAQAAAHPERKILIPKPLPAVFEVNEIPTSAEPIPLPATAAIASPDALKPQFVQQAVDIASLLRSQGGLREAMILREIFGPPRSMQPLDSGSGLTT
jgi:hypothetical protein